MVEHFGDFNQAKPCFVGGNVVLLYASMYDDIKMILNLSGRFDLRTGIRKRLGEEFMQIIEKDGYIDVKDRKGINIMLVRYSTSMYH